MLNKFIIESKLAIRMFLVMFLLLGIIYTGLVTLLGNMFFPNQSQGSLVSINGKIVGSKLIAQKFVDAKYFWSRPSAVDYNPSPSGASNLAATNTMLKQVFADRKEVLMTSNVEPIPADLISSSGSGLDPQISPDSAYYQVPRIVAARKLDKTQTVELEKLIEKYIETRDLNFLGENRVNVFELNLALDEKFSQ